MSDVDLIPLDTIPVASYRVLRSVKRRLSDDEFEGFERRLQEALDYFPALAGQTITIACRREPEKEPSRWNPYANADPVNRLIRIPTSRRCSNVTLFHELAHLAIEIEVERGAAEHPITSEEFCSLYAIARQPPDLIDEDRIPYFGRPEPDREMWPHIAQKALEYREEHHNYVQQANKWFGTTGEDDG